MTSKISSFIDSLEYSLQKKKKNGLKFSEIKEKREENIVLYNQNLEFLKEYTANDSIELPGLIFCVEEVMNSYRHLPGFVNVVSSGPDTLSSPRPTDTTELRRKWLDNTPDKGSYYYDAKNRLLNGSKLIKLSKERESIILDIEKFINKKLTNHQLTQLEKIGNDLQTYKSAKVKSKKLKELYSECIKSITKINNETFLPIHMYLSLLYKIDLCIECNSSTQEKMIFVEYINQLEKTIENEEREQRYIKNVLTRTEEQLHEIIKTLKAQNHQYAKQTGKYFTKWSQLSDLEKKERVDSWIRWYIYKTFMLGKLISTQEEMESLINKLEITLSVKIPYRYIKWNVKAGIITTINGITYSSSDGTFSFSGNSNTTTDNFTNDYDCESTDGVHEQSSGFPDSVSKGTSVTESFLTKKCNEKIANDIILEGILKEYSFKECVDKIKIKLGISKILSNEREILSKKYNHIKSIISNSLLNEN
jgi:hypothetical protein